MIHLQITKINKWQYTLTDIQTNRNYVHSFEFSGLKRPLEVGDQIIMHKELLDVNYAEYSNHYTFGSINEIYGREITSTANIDAIGIKQGKDIISLKRFYG